MVSPRKPATSVNAPQGATTSNLMATSAKSCESLYSASSRESACLIYQRKTPLQRGGGTGGGMKPSPSGSGGHGGAAVARHPSMVATNASEIHQRVMSARNLRIKTFQNQLTDAQAEIANLAHENRMLRTLHKRQSSALSKYESTNAELPQLLHSHAEELRVWQTKCRNLQTANKELEHKLKQKEALILSLSDQNKHYSQLNKDKNLDERQRLQEKLRQLEQRLADKDNDMKLLARKVQLESKNIRQQLLNEQKKSKEVALKLEKARLEISGYRKLEEFTIGGDPKSNAMQANPLSSSSCRRSKILLPDEPDKMDKLDKTLDTLEKALEKSNFTDYNTSLTDVLETDSLYDFDKDIDEVKVEVVAPPLKSPLRNGQLSRTGSNLSKLILPPAKSQPPSTTTHHQPSSTRTTHSQSSTGGGKISSGLSRLRSGEIKGTVGNVGNAASAQGSAASKRRESASKKAGVGKLLEDDGFNPDMDDSYGIIADMCNDGGAATDDDDDDVDNANDMSLLSYAPFMEATNITSELVDNSQDDDDDDDDNDDDDDDDDDVAEKEIEVMIPKGKLRAPSVTENVSSIRKQISNDYKERETFLNTFCRQASSSDDGALKKRNSIAASSGTSHIAGSRKHNLLAALKAIDDSKSQD